jgi:methyl-accepting chemotaxis protein
MGILSGINSRKKYLINKPFQVKLMSWMMGIALAPVSVFFVGHYYFFWQLRNFGLDIKLPPEHIYFRFIETQSNKLFLFFIICGLVAIIVVAILGLFLSHKIAGPIHNLKEHLRKSTDGEDLKNLTFRKNDFFMEIPPIVNKFIESKKSKKDDQ